MDICPHSILLVLPMANEAPNPGAKKLLLEFTAVFHDDFLPRQSHFKNHQIHSTWISIPTSPKKEQPEQSCYCSDMGHEGVEYSTHAFQKVRKR